MKERERDDRAPPARIRVTGMQEAQLRDLAELDAACAAMYHAVGFDAAEVPVRSVVDLVSLERQNRVHVAEADHVVAGYAAWHDEAPGVVYLAELSVHPDFQRFGVGARLFEEVCAGARDLHLEHVIVRCWSKAAWAVAFYRRQGFTAIDASAPAKVTGWVDDHTTGRPLTRPGEVVMWAPVKAAPLVAETDEASEEG